LARTAKSVGRPSLPEPVQPLRHGLSLEGGQRLRAGVDLDPRDHARLLEDLGERRPVLGRLADRLVVQDHAGDMVSEPRGGEEELAIGATVLLRRLDADLVEPLLDRPARLIGGEDPFAGGNQLAGSLAHHIHPLRSSFVCLLGGQRGSWRRVPSLRRADDGGQSATST
jgi:hypothetical protein